MAFEALQNESASMQDERQEQCQLEPPYLAVAVHVCLPYHLVHFLIRELLPQVRHDMPELQQHNQEYQ